MTQPLSMNAEKRVSVTGFAGINGGVFQKSPMLGFQAGAKVNIPVCKTNAYIEANGLAGTAFGGKVKVGDEIKLSDKLGLDISAQAQIAKESFMKPVTVSQEIRPDIDAAWCYHSVSVFPTPWCNFAGGVQLNYKPNDKLTLGLGVEAGKTFGNYHKAESIITLPDDSGNNEGISPDIDSELGKGQSNLSNSFSFDGTTGYISAETGGVKDKNYVTPKASVSYKPTKNIEIFGDASLVEGNAGMRFTF